MRDHILPLEEEDISKELKSIFQKRGIKVLEKTSVESLIDTGIEVEVNLSSNKLNFSKALLSVGVTANVENFGFENTGGSIKNRLIQVDKFCRVVGSKNIFAIGDVIGGKQLAHKASKEGILAAEFAAGKKVVPLNSKHIPSCIYTSPQIASIGYSSKELKGLNIPFEEGFFPFSASGKALALGKNVGYSKVYLHKETGEILGAHLIGAEVTEFISNIGLSITGELTVHEFLQTVFPHPTLSESLYEAFGQAKKESINY